MKCQIFVDILLLIGVVYLIVSCNGSYKNNATYDLHHYTDTIYGKVILTTVCDNHSGGISISTLIIDDFSKIDND